MANTTLNKIVTDLLNIIRGSIVNNTEPISKRQVEDWVHQYRAVLITQDIVKKYYPNPDYIQEIEDLSLEDTGINNLWKTTLEIPKTINLHFKSGITWLGDSSRNEITMTPQSRYVWQQYKRYTANERIAFLEGNHIYVKNDIDPLTHITVKGIFENPMEVMRLANPTIAEPLADMDTPYPIPNNKVATLKQMILSSELKIEATAPGDTTDDNRHNPK